MEGGGIRMYSGYACHCGVVVLEAMQIYDLVGFVVLPSCRLLQYYKNSVNQVSGLNKEMLAWMQNEAKNKNLPPP